MSFKNRINEVRRAILHSLTQNIGNQRTFRSPIDPEKFRRVLISRPNSRLGNQLLITALVQEVIRDFPHCKIDLFVRGSLATVIFKYYDNVDRIICLPRKPFKELITYIGVWFSLRKYRYDIVIDAVDGSSSGRLSTLLAKADIRLYGSENQQLKDKYKDYVHIAKTAIYNLRHVLSLSCPCFEAANAPLPFLDIRLTASEIAEGGKLLEQLVGGREKPTITLYTYATGGKCYSTHWWLLLYEQLKTKYKDRYHIIEVLPVEHVSQIAFKAPSFYSRDIREMAAFMANTAVYIGADCGIMHLASAVNIPVVGLFSTTSIDVYQPYNTRSIAINTNYVTRMDDLIEIIDGVLV
jgi:ADP-heptose:LPS heptosyltransferase